MSDVRPARASDLDAISNFLAPALKGIGGPARYRRLFEYGWLADKPDLGILLEERGQVRGFIGAIYADRWIAGERRRVCNLTSIAVDASHRKHTLRMFGMLFARRDLTFTCFSASEAVAKILEFFKFARTSSERVIIHPFVRLRDGLRRVELISDLRTLERELPPEQREISMHHRPYRCGQFLLVAGARRCFIITARRGRDVRAFADVLYASDPELLLSHLPRLHIPLLRAHATILTGLDRRWVTSMPGLAFHYDRLRAVHVRSVSTAPHAPDALYSELVLSQGAR